MKKRPQIHIHHRAPDARKVACVACSEEEADRAIGVHLGRSTIIVGRAKDGDIILEIIGSVRPRDSFYADGRQQNKVKGSRKGRGR